MIAIDRACSVGLFYGREGCSLQPFARVTDDYAPHSHLQRLQPTPLCKSRSSATHTLLPGWQSTTLGKSRRRSRPTRHAGGTYACAVIHLVRSEPNFICRILVQLHPRQRAWIRTFTCLSTKCCMLRSTILRFIITVTVYVDQQMYTDVFNDQLSDADTEDYSDLPELVDE